MVLTGLWVGKHEYQVTDTVSGKSDYRLIVGTNDEMADPVYMAEMAHFAQESIVRGWKKEKPVPHTPAQRKELGSILKEIGASRDYGRENNHPRYWRGV
tara:strand:- start:11193 stop:11489 length:297 start_codon:yes stop_codon:yes gene_type:complete